MKAKYVIGGIIIAAFLVFAGWNLNNSLNPYVSIKDAKKSGRTVQVKGERIEGSARYDMESKIFTFSLKDHNGETVKVVYHGVKPSNFEQAKEIVAIGLFQNGEFDADQLLVKCPSKYEAEVKS